jgi:hypothetical protein
MKALKITLLLITTVLLLSSCKKETVTYRFDEEDKIKLLPHYIKGKIFTFANEAGEERKFKVEEIIQYTKQDFVIGGMMGRDDYYFYYEHKRFNMKDLSTQYTFFISIRRYPINVEQARENIYKKQASHLRVLIGGIELGYYFDFDFNLSQTSQPCTFNGITYTDVIVAPNDLIKDVGGMLMDAKIVYYDVYQGIVGFDDINNHKWRLVNSK